MEDNVYLFPGPPASASSRGGILRTLLPHPPGPWRMMAVLPRQELAQSVIESPAGSRVANSPFPHRPCKQAGLFPTCQGVSTTQPMSLELWPHLHSPFQLPYLLAYFRLVVSLSVFSPSKYRVAFLANFCICF